MHGSSVSTTHLRMILCRIAECRRLARCTYVLTWSRFPFFLRFVPTSICDPGAAIMQVVGPRPTRTIPCGVLPSTLRQRPEWWIWCKSWCFRPYLRHLWSQLHVPSCVRHCLRQIKELWSGKAVHNHSHYQAQLISSIVLNRGNRLSELVYMYIYPHSFSSNSSSSHYRLLLLGLERLMQLNISRC